MSQLISYVPASNGSVKSQGAKLVAATLSASAASASAVISDGGTGVLTVTVAANVTTEVFVADTENGYQFAGQPSITITGVGAVLTLEWL